MQLVPPPPPPWPTSAFGDRCAEPLRSTMTAEPLRSRMDEQHLQRSDTHRQAIEPQQHHAPLVTIQTERSMPDNDNSHMTTQVSAEQRPSTELSQFVWPLSPQVHPHNFELVDLTCLSECLQWANESPTSFLRISNWVELPGRQGSFIRLREVADRGRGMVFFSWANHRRLLFPDKPEMIMEFQNFTVQGGPYIITLEPGDALVWCPAKYMWPACVVCGKFLFPCDDHRCSQRHQKKVTWWWLSLRSLQDLYSSRSYYAQGFVKKNLRGLANPW